MFFQLACSSSMKNVLQCYEPITFSYWKQSRILLCQCIISSQSCDALFSQAQQAKRRHEIDRVNNTSYSLQNYKERIVRISLLKFQSIVICSIQNISPLLTELPLTTIQTDRREKQLKGSFILCHWKETILENKLCSQVNAHMKNRPKLKKYLLFYYHYQTPQERK